MLNQNPAINAICYVAMEQYFRQEGISGRRRADPALNKRDVLDGVRNFLRVVRCMLAAHSTANRPQPQGAQQGAVPGPTHIQEST